MLHIEEVILFIFLLFWGVQNLYEFIVLKSNMWKMQI